MKDTPSGRYTLRVPAAHTHWGSRLPGAHAVGDTRLNVSRSTTVPTTAPAKAGLLTASASSWAFSTAVSTPVELSCTAVRLLQLVLKTT
jgi:hypothetical protein